MYKITLGGTLVLTFGLSLTQGANAAEGYSPYSGTVETDFQKGGKFDLGTKNGVDAWNQFNSPPPPIKVVPPPDAPNVDFINKSFVIDKVNSMSSENGETVSMNVFNRGYADAALEVYDANGKLVGVPIFIEGNRPATSVVDFTVGNMVSIKKGLTDEYPWYDVRDEGGASSKKTDIQGIFIPYGGYVKVSKSSTWAQGYNFATMALEILGKVDLIPAKGKVSEKMLRSIVEEIAKQLPDLGKKLASRGEMEWSDISLLVKIVGNVVIEPSNFDGRKKFTKFLTSIGGKSLGNLNTASELIALTLNTTGQLYDMEKSMLRDGETKSTREVFMYASKDKAPSTTKRSELRQWATVTMQNQLSAITNGSASHIGSASLYSGYGNQANANINPNNTNNFQPQTGAQQSAFSLNTQAFQSSDWVLVTGDPAIHTAVGNSFGAITAPDGGQIASLNNANVPYTTLTKDFYVPVGVKQVTLTFNGNFVTNEYPVYVGSQFNDSAQVKITSPSGNATSVTAFNQALNSSNFTTVNNLPTPLTPSGGQTGWKASIATINVAGGGKVTVEVRVANIGDVAVPSAVLLNKVTVK